MTDNTRNFLAAQASYVHLKEFPEGHISVEMVANRLTRHESRPPELWIACVNQQLFNASIIIFPERTATTGFEDSWDYRDVIEAVIALENWNGIGEPEGWIRHPRTGRRRPNGDPKLEYTPTPD